MEFCFTNHRQPMKALPTHHKIFIFYHQQATVYTNVKPINAAGDHTIALQP